MVALSMYIRPSDKTTHLSPRKSDRQRGPPLNGFTSQRVARNSALYFLSLALPAVAALFLVPITVRALGPSRFGLLALAWAVAEGAGMFDLGLGRATVRFVADATERGPERLKEIVVASVFSQVAMGVVAGVVLFFVTPVFVGNVFSIAPAAIPEATAMFRVLAVHLPIQLSGVALRSALEGAQRFDLTTALRIPGSLASVAIPAAAASAGASLATIMWLLLAVRLVLVLISAAAVSRALLGGRWGIPTGVDALREILGYSGWVAVSAALSPALASIDRFVVGGVVGVTALGFYTGASEAANRFLMIPGTAFAALLPALALTHARGARDRTLEATRAARRQLAALLLPLCLALLVFAPGILRVWLGPDFASAAGTALRVLAVGVFFGGLAHLPMALLYGSGRPDLPAKIHLAEVWIHVPLTFALVKGWGITGAALAWTIRCGADWLLYEWVSRRAIGRYPINSAERALTAWLSWSGLALAAALTVAIWLGQWSWQGALAVTMLGLTIYAAVGWSRVLSDEERRAWLSMVFRLRDHRLRPHGSFPDSISRARDEIDFWLTRFPRLYLFVDRFRHWVNWDKRLYLCFIKPGSIVLDIGANTGTHTAMFSHLAGEPGRVLAFEPVPTSFERLQETLGRRSRFANVSTFQMAVGNPGSRQETMISVPGDDLTQASLKIQTEGSWEKRSDIRHYPCSITSIDAETAQAALPRLDFVKIDVEGGELDVLKGAAQSLSKYRPLIYCEVYEKWTAAFGYTSAELFAFVRSLGYKGARVIREGEVHSLTLDDYTIAGMFDVSSNVLFFSDRHVQPVDRFDKRFHVAAAR